jgi:Alw26I/Eco31I/Esp3I family type II restriction m6 adenine DNA methyltransferase
VEAAELRGVFDVVITNPPWEQVKPDRRELALLDDDAQRRYLGSLKDWSAFLATTYSAARPRQHFAGWGMNLSRAGTDVAMRLTAQDGLCAVVSPASFLADTNSEELRRALFARMSLRAVGYFPAEARLFEDVDVPCIAFVAHARRSKTVQTFVSHFSREHSRVERRSVRLDADSLRKGGWVVPVAFGAAGIELLAAFDDLPAFDALESTGNLWAGRELDETRKERYLKPVGNHPFAKGVNIRRFGIAAIPTVYVNEAVVRLPASVNHPRLAWRDVSRPSQKRRVHATLIPAGWVTGNSLGVAYRKDDDLKRLAALLGIFNSLTWEYQLRARLSTGHISLSSVRLVRLPRLTPLDEVHLAELAIQALEGIDQAETRLEVEVARAYGLDASAWDCILDSYPKLTSSERDALVAAWAT